MIFIDNLKKINKIPIKKYPLKIKIKLILLIVSLTNNHKFHTGAVRTHHSNNKIIKYKMFDEMKIFNYLKNQ